MIGMDGKRLARQIAAANGRELSEADTERIDKAAGAAFDRRNDAPRPLPGVADVLAAIAELQLSWLVATSSRRAQVTTSVGALELQDEPEIVDGSHVEHAKPAPDLLLLAAERLGLAPSRCWAIGDSTWDVRAARAAGMAAVGVTAGSAVASGDLTEAGATRVVATLGRACGPAARGPGRRRLARDEERRDHDEDAGHPDDGIEQRPSDRPIRGSGATTESASVHRDGKLVGVANRPHQQPDDQSRVPFAQATQAARVRIVPRSSASRGTAWYAASVP